MKLQLINILVIQNATSTSTSAIRLAVTLTNKSGGKVRVIDFVKQPNWIWRDLISLDRHMDDQLDDRADAIHQLISKADINDENVDVEILDGRPINEIVKRVIRGKYDIVIKDASTESAELLFGSLDMKLMRYCPIPVLLTVPNSVPGFQKILAAVDPESDPVETNLNEVIIQRASEMAQLNSAELHVLGVWQSPGFDFDNSEENIEQFEQIKIKVKQRATDSMNTLLGRSSHPIDPTNVHFVHGDPQQSIVETAVETNADLLVIGSQARIGVPGLLIGNVAEEVLRQVNCAVLTLKPEGFESPLGMK